VALLDVDSSPTKVQNNGPRSSYEITVDGREVGFAEYRRRGDTVVFPHTEIAPSMRNRGLGAELVRGALDDVRARGSTVVAQCWCVAEFIDQHTEYADLLAQK
jgi:predicted GNAT family acetyltransferase